MPEGVELLELGIVDVAKQGYENGFESTSSPAYVDCKVPVCDHLILGYISLEVDIETLKFTLKCNLLSNLLMLDVKS